MGRVEGAEELVEDLRRRGHAPLVDLLVQVVDRAADGTSGSETGAFSPVDAVGKGEDLEFSVGPTFRLFSGYFSLFLAIFGVKGGTTVEEGPFPVVPPRQDLSPDYIYY